MLNRAMDVLKVIGPATAIAAFVYFLGYTWEASRASVFGLSPRFFDRSQLDYILTGVPITLTVLVVLVGIVGITSFVYGLALRPLARHRHTVVFSGSLAVLLLVGGLVLGLQIVMTREPSILWSAVIIGGLALVFSLIAIVSNPPPNGPAIAVEVGRWLAAAALILVLGLVAAIALDPVEGLLAPSKGAEGLRVGISDRAHLMFLASVAIFTSYRIAREVREEPDVGAGLRRVDYVLAPEPTDETSHPNFAFVGLQGESRSVWGVALAVLVASAVAVYASTLVSMAGRAAGEDLLGVADGRISASESEMPEVVVYTDADTPLELDLPGVDPVRVSNSTRLRYHGLFLLHRSQDGYLLAAFSAAANPQAGSRPVVFLLPEQDGVEVLVDNSRAILGPRREWLRGDGLDRFLFQTDEIVDDDVPGDDVPDDEVDSASLLAQVEVTFGPITAIGLCPSGNTFARWQGLAMYFSGQPVHWSSEHSELAGPLGRQFVGWRYDEATVPALTTAGGRTLGDTSVDESDIDTVFASSTDGELVVALHAGEASCDGPEDGRAEEAVPTCYLTDVRSDKCEGFEIVATGFDDSDPLSGGGPELPRSETGEGISTCLVANPDHGGQRWLWYVENDLEDTQVTSAVTPRSGWIPVEGLAAVDLRLADQEIDVYEEARFDSAAVSVPARVVDNDIAAIHVAADGEEQGPLLRCFADDPDTGRDVLEICWESCST